VRTLASLQLKAPLPELVGGYRAQRHRETAEKDLGSVRAPFPSPQQYSKQDSPPLSSASANEHVLTQDPGSQAIAPGWQQWPRATTWGSALLLCHLADCCSTPFSNQDVKDAPVDMSEVLRLFLVHCACRRMWGVVWYGEEQNENDNGDCGCCSVTDGLHFRICFRSSA